MRLDSGATRSYLPLDDAELLEVELTPLSSPVQVLGSEIDCYESSAEVQARVWTGDEHGFWGGWVALNPMYGDAQDRLLGLSDFFAPFEVTFESGREPPSVLLEQA